MTSTESTQRLQLVQPSLRALLSRQEMRVLLHVAAGLTTPEIASMIGLSPETIKTYRETIISKFAARNMPHAVAKAFDQQVIKIGSLAYIADKIALAA